MPRKKLIRHSEFPYYVSAFSYDEFWFGLTMDEVWNIAQKSLREAYDLHKVELISFLLMPNHYQMILKTPEGNIDLFMYEFNKRFALSLKKKSGHSKHIFAARYRWCLLKSDEVVKKAYRFVYQNPKRAEIVNRCEHYPYSTLNLLVERMFFSIPLFDQVDNRDLKKLNWLNESLDPEEESYLKKKMQRSVFEERKKMQRKTKEPNEGN